MTTSIIDISRDFFDAIVKPILLEHFPEETSRTAFGIFGYGSEALRLDDEYSRDHHWGLRIDALMPDDVFAKQAEMIKTLTANLPDSYEGHSLHAGHQQGAGFVPNSLNGFLKRTIGMERAPQTYTEWLHMPEEDIIHVINGEVWYDPSGEFTAIRQTLGGYYPEPVRLRRIAHWCRYFSGMGTYALKRAILRNNDYYANITFSRALQRGVQLAFLLDKQYFPYDKWAFSYLQRLPRMSALLVPIVEEASKLSTSWECKLDLLDQMADILDETMIADGLIKPHPKFQSSPTSGYRIMEHAYAELIQNLSDEIKTVVPIWDQIYLEEFHSGYVDSIPLDEWDQILNLTPSE